MAKKIDNIFLIIEANASDFLSIGLGISDDIVTGHISGGLFAGFEQIIVGGGKEMICDDCNAEIAPSETCYYIAVLNRIFCTDCYHEWIAGAKYYSEDKPFEERNYNMIKSQLEDAGLWQE